MSYSYGPRRPDRSKDSGYARSSAVGCQGRDWLK